MVWTSPSGSRGMPNCFPGVEPVPQWGLRHERKGRTRHRGRAPGGLRSHVTIRDYGCGMSPEVMKQAIEPFFTTRPPGKGSGLGLSMAYGTVRDHHGKLSLDSKEGEGTTVTLEFPTLANEMHPHPLTTNTNRAKSPESRLHLPKGLTVLLVDDDEGVRQVIEDLLLSQGCQVISRASGGEAIAYVDSDSPPVDLIVLDRMMPGLLERRLSSNYETWGLPYRHCCIRLSWMQTPACSGARACGLRSKTVFTGNPPLLYDKASREPVVTDTGFPPEFVIISTWFL